MKPPEHEDGGPVSRTAAIEDPSRPKPDCHSASVNAAQVALWIDEAIATYRRAGSDPVEFQRLGIWLQRMRRALP
jgi:hypothetical protein